MVVWLLVVVTIGFGVVANRGIAGGSDSYGYVSQADLWLRGDLHISQPMARKLPWPFAQWTLSPLGYCPSPDQGSIVPVYAPGLPLLMAGFKLLAGQCGMAWVVPLCGGLLVAATFGIGRKVFSDQVGAAGALLVATSPVLLFMLTQPMSDVAVAAFWALATLGSLMDSGPGTLVAAGAATMAILIRPNLAGLGVLMGFWLVVRDFKSHGWRGALSRAALYAMPVLAAVAGVAVLYRRLYGAATASGYGPIEKIYSLSAGPANLLQYAQWLVTSQTPVALVGAIALFVPLRMTDSRRIVGRRTLLALICGGTVLSYIFWNVFDAWWYLRFLLPMWPAICLSSAWLLTWPSGRAFSKVGIVAVACVSAYCLWFAYRAGTFNLGEGDRRYAVVARLVRDATPANSIVFSTQHSGSVRYYGSRMTLRYDWLSERWLDRSVEWLSEHGVHPYFLLDEGEVKDFRRRFEPLNTLGRLDVAHVWEYHGGPTVILYDPLEPPRPGEKITIFTPADVRLPSCPEPAPAPRLTLMD